ncbi:pickpocket protein 19-like isoform X1 [Phlebotomus papatasi]|uniref:pickpocket protein 19-like isoform X1 n=1 Tax=Phlebotomus papatasi TaxID=29031 RepID=UPI0024835A15|nr:pickpocket protein 19-like isoform X1 [Phlebotomus papatasi]
MLSDEFQLDEKLPQNNNKFYRELEHVNFGQVLREVSPRCSRIFQEPCWWRNKFFNCCTIFSTQVSTYGHCLSFNSLSSQDAPNHWNESDWPWRTSNYGHWSGLRVTMKGSQTKGVLVVIHHPEVWPQTAKFIPTGSITIFSITPTFAYSSSGVKRFPPAQRGCFLENN